MDYRVVIVIFIIILILYLIQWRNIKEDKKKRPIYIKDALDTLQPTVVPVKESKEEESKIITRIVKYNEYKYLKGNLRGKFHGIQNKYYSDQNNEYQYSNITKIYDAEVYDLEGITKEEYDELRSLNNALIFRELKVKANYLEDQYDLTINDLKFTPDHKPRHVQFDGDEVMGDLDGGVTFALVKQREKEITFEVSVVKANEEVVVKPSIEEVGQVISESDIKTVTGEIRSEVKGQIRRNTSSSIITGNPKKDDSFWKVLLSILFLILIGFSFIPAVGVGFLFFLIPLIIGAIILWLFDHVSWLAKVFRYIFVGGLLLLVGYGLFDFISHANRNWNNTTSRTETIYNNNDDLPEEVSSDTPELSEVDWKEKVRLEEKDSAQTDDKWIIHHRIWDSKGVQYETDVKLLLMDYYNSKFTRQQNNNFNVSFAEEYSQMIAMDSSKFGPFYKAMDSISANNYLSRSEFAHLLVNFVQDIKYAYVLDESCSTVGLYGGYQDGGSNKTDCIGFIRFGVQSPAEFIGNLKGDCDTRTVFLYMVLKHYGYDVAIFSSTIYAHSILGLNLGYELIGADKLMHNGKIYYPWETTNVGFGLGELPTEVDNPAYWYLELK